MFGSSEGWLARWRRWLGVGAKRSPVEGGGGGQGGDGGYGGSDFGGGGAVFWTPNGPVFGNELPTAAYENVATVYACVSKIAQSLAQVELRFYAGVGKDRREIERKPGNIVDLWSKANRRFSNFELVEQIQSGLDLNGNAFILIEQAGGFVTGFATMPPQNVEVRVNKAGLVTAYALDTGGGQPLIFAPEDVVHVKYFNPRWGVRGMSPLVAGADAWQTVAHSTAYTRDLFKRSGEGTAFFETDGGVSDDQLNRIEKKLAIRQSNPMFRGRPVVMPKGMKRVPASMTAAELKAVETKLDSKLEILEVFGVPPWKMGIKVGGGIIGGGAGAEVDERMWVTDCLMPRAKRIELALNEFLLEPLFSDEGTVVTCEFDFSRHPAIQQAFLSRAKAVSEVVNKVVTTNEGREFLGLEKLEGEEFDTITTPAPFGAVDPANPDGQDQPGKDKQPTEPAPKDKEKAKAALEAERRFARRQHGKSLRRYERRTEKVVRAQMERQESRVLAAWGERGSRAPDPLSLADVLAELTEMERQEWEELLWGILQDRGEEALALLGAEVDFRLNEAQWASWIRRHVDRALKASETTRRVLRERIATVVGEGGGLSQVAEAVREVFDDRRANAVTIARTETHPAYNAASLEAADQSGVVEGKMWVAVHDDVVRPEHAAAEEQGTIPLSEPFVVGRDLMMYPGEVGASPEMTINCRCGLRYALVTDRGAKASTASEVIAAIEERSRKRRVGAWMLGRK